LSVFPRVVDFSVNIFLRVVPQWPIIRKKPNRRKTLINFQVGIGRHFVQLPKLYMGGLVCRSTNQVAPNNKAHTSHVHGIRTGNQTFHFRLCKDKKTKQQPYGLWNTTNIHKKVRERELLDLIIKKLGNEFNPNRFKISTGMICARNF
jgi:hypothetical protein